MANETLARRYAVAIFGLAKDQNVIPQVRHDLHTVVDALAVDETIRKFYRSPVVDRKEKATIIGTAFDKLNEIALHSVLLLIRKRRENMLEEIVAQYDVLEQRSRNASPLHIETARELSKPELDALVARLAQRYNTTFDVTQTVDPQLIGGVRITMGDKRIDGSVSGRLDDLARMLSTN
jgi:F-type H+-transporting ATPase subunit delta